MHTEGMNKKIMVIALFSIIACAASLIRGTPFESTAFEHEKIQSYGRIGLYAEDTLIKDGRRMIETPYDWLIILTGMKNTLPIIFGAVSAALFYILLIKLGIKERTAFFSAMLMTLTPLFASIFSLNNYYSMVMLLNIAGILCRNKKYASAVIYSAIALFGAFNFIISALLLLIACRNTALKRIMAPAAVSAVHTAWMIYQNAVYHPETAYAGGGIIAGIGSINGVSAFFAILAIIGAATHWKSNKQQIFISAMLFAFSLFYSAALNFSLLIMSVLAGAGLSAILEQKWSTEYLKKLTLFVFMLGILFSLITYSTAVIKEFPTEETIKGYEFLKGQESGAILTHASRGNVAGLTAKKPALLEENPQGIKNYEEKLADSEKIFHTYDLKGTAELLKKHGIKYIAVDSQMKTGLVWEKENQELLYLLGAKEYFKKIYSNSEIEIWQFQPAENLN